MDQTPHEIINPLSLPDPVGYSHALVVAPGRTVYVGGQMALRSDGVLTGDSLVQQFDHALANVVEALRTAGAEPAHVVSMRVYTTSVGVYRVNLKALGSIYRRHMGRYYPPMAVLGVTELLEEGAQIELECVAVVPDSRDGAELDEGRPRELVEEVDDPFADAPATAEPGEFSRDTRP
ncbi:MULTISPECIES: RidA family protein [unclassified Nocardiopsis]|jgi:enamine deaminase RidA (YjgF/YER057c/UK114 family)|uniref:RidA family protein n=1 Tax=unclassified Nocardiopsis TaxID=2649073 RepID=UPI00066C8EFC|nr:MULTISPECIES: RidA family protein [unclassified Nocardiopsis]MBQ1084671.1 RidA family protein [Nocardiopsis sp. B62]